jgi:hypothetical protein
MGIFFSKPQPPSRADRLKAFRSALYNSKAAHDISRADFISTLEGIVANEKMAHAFTAPIESTRPRTTVVGEEPVSPLRRFLGRA